MAVAVKERPAWESAIVSQELVFCGRFRREADGAAGLGGAAGGIEDADDGDVGVE